MLHFYLINTVCQLEYKKNYILLIITIKKHVNLYSELHKINYTINP